jgi:sugar/nucleoside kinase (ribokinase family)
MKIITLGTATLDFILKTKQKLSFGTKVDIDEIFISLGGGALNAVTTFKNLNLDYLAYFRLGKDLIGQVILDKLKKEKIKSKIFFHQGLSQFSTVVLNHERTIFVYRGLSENFSLGELNQIPVNDYYYLTTANTEPKIFQEFLKRIKKKAKLISLNPSKKFLQSKFAENCLRLVDILFLDENEAEIFLKRKLNPLKLGQEIYRKLGLKIFVLTLGNQGSLTFFEEKIFQAGIFKPQKIVDTTGAGDAFGSAFFAKLVLEQKINEKTIRKAILWGSANASANIEKLGAQIGILKKNEYLIYEKKKLPLRIWKS